MTFIRESPSHLWAVRDRSEKSLALIFWDSVTRNRLLQNPVSTICVSGADPDHTHILLTYLITFTKGLPRWR